ncbi:hypothetical protein HHE03_04990 [Helicobacter heilmannii]|nr:hypothetical protein HHE03_04990 [Helicobacter heilmannii]
MGFGNVCKGESAVNLRRNFWLTMASRYRLLPFLVLMGLW